MLNAERREAVTTALEEACAHRGWHLTALNARTTHVYIVVTASQQQPEAVMNAFKAWSTRRLREAGFAGKDEKVWSRHGSTRYLWTEKDVDDACGYVIHGQGLPLPGRLEPPAS